MQTSQRTKAFAITAFLTGLTLVSCTPLPAGLTIRETHFSRNTGPIAMEQYHQLLQEVIHDGNAQSFRKLIHFNCGGASGCYFHGEILAQVSYLIGEEEVLDLIADLNKDDKKYLEHLLGAGLEYGEFEGRDKGLLLKDEFPLLYEALPRNCYGDCRNN